MEAEDWGYLWILLWESHREGVWYPLVRACQVTARQRPRPSRRKQFARTFGRNDDKLDSVGIQIMPGDAFR